MFTFHKPKVFRSAHGCCICGAKSSSSRFTDSKRYGACFDRCFDLDGKIRAGEICNACVLLVKRFMKLPSGTLKNWNHVVDARSGPGIKSMVRGRNKNLNSLNANKQINGDSDGQDLTPEKPILKRKHVYRSKTSNTRINKDIRNNNISKCLIKSRHPKKQPAANIRRKDITMEERHKQRREGAGEFLDETMWKKQKICCGFIFIGPNGEVAVDHRFLQRCDACKLLKEPAIPSTVTSAAHTNGDESIRFTASMVSTSSKSLLREFDEVSMDITNAEDESAEESDSLGDDQCASSLCSSQSEDAIRAAKLAFDVESEVAGNSDFAVDADEGFFDKQLGSPTSTSSRASTPPPVVPHILSHPSNSIHHQHQSPTLIQGGTT